MLLDEMILKMSIDQLEKLKLLVEDRIERYRMAHRTYAEVAAEHKAQDAEWTARRAASGVCQICGRG